MTDTVHRTQKPWGHELLFAKTGLYAGKLLFIRAGEALSLQYHERKDEAIYVQSGRLQLELGEPGKARSESVATALAIVLLAPGQSHHIPPLTRHRFSGLEDTTLFEVSTPELDDVVRLEDRYGRTGTSAP